MCNKKFLTYKEQIEKLKNKGLTILDENEAIQYLKRLSYYSLISGYKKIFQNPCSKKYLKQIDFNNIVQFYFFDNELRLLFLKHIIIIEQNIKSLLSYEFCNEYGENQNKYLSHENYLLTDKNKSEINKLIAILSDLINKNDYPFITYNKEKYNNVPLWILMHTITFGQLSKMYSFQKNIIKAELSSQVQHLMQKDFDWRFPV